MQYARITGRLAAMAGDNPTQTGGQPTITYATGGQVKFDPLVSREQAAGLFIVPPAIYFDIDPNGWLTRNGQPHGYILDLGDPTLPTSVDRSQGAYQVSFIGVTVAGQTIEIESFYCNPDAANNDTIDPDTGVTPNDLSQLAPLAALSGLTQITRGPAGPPGAAGPAGVVQTIQAGTNITVDAMDPANPIINAADGGTSLTNYSQVADLEGYPAKFPPDLTGVTPASIGAQPTGSYATQDALTAGLAGKADSPIASTDVTDFTTAVDARVQTIVGAAPAALDTLAEIAAALGDDANFAGTITAQLATKYTEPAGGIPPTDLAAGVQISLGKADSAVQPADLPTPPPTVSVTDAGTYYTITIE